MASKWTDVQIKKIRDELYELYVVQNKTISEIALRLRRDPSTIYDRLVAAGLTTQRLKKRRANNQRIDVRIPTAYSEELAEIVGILLGDGHISATQVTVTLGKKEAGYVRFVSQLFRRVFKCQAKTMLSRAGDLTVYIGSVALVKFFLQMGLVSNKVRKQVAVPNWIFSSEDFMKSCLRGLIDTDGSIYRIRNGLQISFCNRSLPLLKDVRTMMIELGFHPSRISCDKIYLTRRSDFDKFFREIGFSNPKHQSRFTSFNHELGGSYSGNYM